MDTAHGDPLRRKEDTSDDRTELKGPPVPSREASERVLSDRPVPTDAAQSQVVLGADDPYLTADVPEQGATFAALDLGGTESHQRASFSDPIAPPEMTADGDIRPDEA